MSSSGRLSRVVLGALACALGGCADFSRGAPAPAPDAGAPADGGQGADGGDSGALSFATDVYPLLVPTCQTCHGPSGQAADTGLVFTGTAGADYATVVLFVDTAAPAGSRLLTKMTGNGHQGGAVYAAGSPAYQTILQWIQQGAPE